MEILRRPRVVELWHHFQRIKKLQRQPPGTNRDIKQ